MSRIKKLTQAAMLVAGLALAGAASAGPIIIAGTDADDHGSVSAGVNLTGWKFMQQAFEQIALNYTGAAPKKIVCIGCNGSTASAAFASSTGLASITGYSTVTLTSTTDITNFFNGTGATNISNSAVIYMPTVASNVGGGITDAQLAIVNLNGAAINAFVTAGGGLFTQEQANSTIGYGWLTSLLPGFLVFGDGHPPGIVDSGTLQLTAQGNAQFPTLTNTDISNATPWHAWFAGNLGALQTLIVGNGNGIGGFNDPVVIGGGFAGGGGVIIGTPEPETIALFGIAAGALLAARRRRKS